MSRELHRQIIMSHFSKPNHKIDHKLDDHISISTNEIATCDDKFEIYIKYDTNIKNIKFFGRGCTISTSALDIISEELIGKTKEQALSFIKDYVHFIQAGDTSKFQNSELIAFQNVNKQVNRIECATLGARTIEKAVQSV